VLLSVLAGIDQFANRSDPFPDDEDDGDAVSWPPAARTPQHEEKPSGREDARVAAKDDRLAELYAAAGRLKPRPWKQGGVYRPYR